MTIDNENYKNVYSGNGSVTDFAFTFQIAAETEVLVTVDDSDLTYSTDYTVTLNDDGTGTVSCTTAPASGTSNVVLRLNSTFTQEVDLEETGAFSSGTLEEIADKLTRLIKQVKEITSRAIVQNPNQTTEIEFPSPSSNLLIGWNEDADGLENKTPMDADAQTAAELAADEAEAAQIAAEAAQAAAEDARDAAEAIAGWEVATEAEAISGANNTKVMTPLRVEQAFLDNILDEDDFASDSATLPPSQQSVSAYISSNIGVVQTVQKTYAGNITLPTSNAVLSDLTQNITKVSASTVLELTYSGFAENLNNGYNFYLYFYVGGLLSASQMQFQCEATDNRVPISRTYIVSGIAAGSVDVKIYGYGQTSGGRLGGSVLVIKEIKA